MTLVMLTSSAWKSRGSATTRSASSALLVLEVPIRASWKASVAQTWGLAAPVLCSSSRSAASRSTPSRSNPGTHPAQQARSTALRSGCPHMLLDPRQQDRHRTRVRWGRVQQAMAGVREEDDGEVFAIRLAEPLERRRTLLRRLRTILAAVDPDPGHRHLLEDWNRIEAGRLQLPCDLCLL